VDANPFAPPRTTDLSEDAPADGSDLRALEPEAIEALVGAGRWARWAGAIGLFCAALFLGRFLVVTLGFRKPPEGIFTAVFSGLGVVALAPVAWLTWRFDRSTVRLADRRPEAVEEVLSSQAAVFGAYGVLTLLLAVLTIAAPLWFLLSTMRAGRD
jgi:hypothetical protein